MEKKDVLKVVETLMSIPGMNDVLKIDLKMSRKNALLLSTVIESGLNVKDTDRAILMQAIPKDALNEISQIALRYFRLQLIPHVTSGGTNRSNFRMAGCW